MKKQSLTAILRSFLRNFIMPKNVAIIMKKQSILIPLLLLALIFNNPAVSTARSKKAAADKYSLNITSNDILLNESFTLSVSGVTDEDVSFSSSTDKVSLKATDDATSCECLGAAVGKANVTATIKEKGFLFFSKSTVLTCKVTVTPMANSIKFTKKKLQLQEGKKKKLAITIRPSISVELPQYSSSKPEVASVSTTGTVTAKKAGTTVITATIQNKTEAVCTIKVRKAPSKDEKNQNENNTDDDDNQDGNENNE